MTAIAEASRCGGAKLPLGPLEEILERSLDDIAAPGWQTRRACSTVRHAELLGVHQRQLYRWRHQGLTWAQADLLAVRIGFHPGDVWGRDWWALEGEQDDERDDDCGGGLSALVAASQRGGGTDA